MEEQDGVHNTLYSLSLFPGNQSFSEQVAPSNKPPMMGPPTRIHLLHEPSGYGYIGDLCVPNYNLTSRGHTPRNGKWRVVCRAPSQLFTVLLAMDMPQGDYLQMRRRALRGSTQTFHGSSLKKNSVLFGHVKSGGLTTEQGSPFRLAYFCASKFNVGQQHPGICLGKSGLGICPVWLGRQHTWEVSTVDFLAVLL